MTDSFIDKDEPMFRVVDDEPRQARQPVAEDAEDDADGRRAEPSVDPSTEEAQK